MLNRLRNLPIRTKVTLVILLTTGIVLLAAAIALYAFQLAHFRREFIRNTAVLAEIVANNNTAAIEFADPDAAKESLNLVRARADILQATIRRNDGSIFARYNARTNLALEHHYPAQGHAFEGEHLLYTQPIRFNGVSKGRLELCSNFMDLYHESVRIYAIILGAVVLACGLLAYLISARLARFITAPILRLTYLARTVTECQNYSVRAEYHTKDEMGVLARTFNQMLDHVHQSNAIMQNQISERTMAAAELREAKERAEAASKAKSQFLANISHEIRTPLNGVMGMLHLLQKTPLQTQQNRYVNHARTAAETLLTVIGDVLDFSRIEAGKLELESEPFSPRDLLHQTVIMFAERAERQNLELLSHVEPGVPAQVAGDANRLRQILINLLGNALKFTKQGHISVTCRLLDADPDTVRLHFAVADTGCGIAPDQHARVFDAFSQADNSMTRVHGGTGLGLAISRQLCGLMGGEITLQSTPGVGSVFAFTVELKPADATELVPRASRACPKVLILDDSAASRELLLEQIRAWRGEAVAVDNPAEAFQTLRTATANGAPFAVVLIDWKMPGTSAPAIAKTLNTDASLGRPQPVLLSSYSPEEDAGQLRELGFAASVSKPVRQSELFDAIMNALRGDAMTKPTVAPPAAMSDTAFLRANASLVVLLAEDNAINQEVASEMLDAFGHRCLCVVNGREAVEAIQRQRPHLVLMDCQMPILDGYGATREIRNWEAQQNLPRLPIIALTAHALKGDRERCLAAGMDDYLAKPLDPEVLAATIVRWSKPTVTTVTPIPQKPKPVLPAGKPIDDADFLQRCLGRRSLAERLLQKFVIQAAGDAADIRSAIAQHDSEALTAAAQRLRSSATNVSATRLNETAMELDALARSGSLIGAEELAAKLAVRLNEVCEFVAANRDRAGDATTVSPKD